MSAGELLRHYERVTDSPDAVKRLCRFVLELAVRGKLVPQFAGDEQSADLLALAGDASSAGNSLPRGWFCATVGQLLDFKYGKGLASSDRSTSGPTPVFGSNGVVGFTTTPLTAVPSIIVGRKGSAGALNISDGPSWTTDVAYYIEPPPFFQIRYLCLALSALGLDALGKGVKPGLSRSDAYELEMWVPPLAEQHRIVAKVDELLALCDRLEATRLEREATRDRLTAASLHRLNRPDLGTFVADTRQVIAAFPALTARADQVRSMRDTVLRLALLGQFSEALRWPDQPRPLKEFVRLQSGYAFKSEWFGPSGVRLLRNVNVSHGRVNWADEAFLPAHLCPDYQRFMLNAGDIVLSLNRPFIATGTKVAQIQSSDLPALLVQRVARLKLAETLLPEYLLLWLQCSLFQEQVQPVSTNVAPHIAPADIGNAKIFVPELEEQRRIVSAVKTTLALCDRLEMELRVADLYRERLLDALIQGALSPAESLAGAE